MTAIPCLADLHTGKRLIWGENRLYVDFYLPLSPGSDLSPVSRFEAEQKLQEEFQALVLKTILGIPVDSFFSIGDDLQDHRTLSKKLFTTIEAGRKEYSFLYFETKTVHLGYSFPFYGEAGLASAFIRHEQTNPLPARIGFTATRSYTGLIIYAKGEYPLFGKAERPP